MPNGEYLRFDQILWRAIQKSRDRLKFDTECREAMKDKTRAEARAILIEQYRRIGEQPLGQPLLDRKLDMLIAPVSASSRISDVVDGVSTLVGAGVRLRKILQGPTEEDLRSHRKSDLHVTPDWHHTCRVAVTADAESWLGEVDVTGLIAFRDMSAIAITIEASDPRVEGGELRAFVDDRLAGTITDSDSEPFWAVIEGDATDILATLGTYALRTQDGGQWRLDVGVPERVRRHFPFDDEPQGDPGV